MTINPNPTPLPRKDDSLAAKQNAVNDTLCRLECLQEEVGDMIKRLRAILDDAGNFRDCDGR